MLSIFFIIELSVRPSVRPCEPWTDDLSDSPSGSAFTTLLIIEYRDNACLESPLPSLCIISEHANTQTYWTNKEFAYIYVIIIRGLCRIFLRITQWGLQKSKSSYKLIFCQKNEWVDLFCVNNIPQHQLISPTFNNQQKVCEECENEEEEALEW